MRCELISWARVLHLVGSLAERIQAAGFQPDRVVAIARGGYVPARLLCDRLNLYALDSIRIAHYRAGAAKSPVARLVSTLNSDIRACNVLLVDDVADTGDTLALAVDYLRNLKPRAVKVAVLQHKSQSPFIPDFCAEEVRAWRWLVYPWALAEDLGGFLAAMNPAPDDPEQLVERLRWDYGIKVSTRLAQQILEAVAGRTASRPAG
ncbi:MAG: phosphoribosyltransferase [Gammaproteobacteria bacterium]|nr:phosphoribosyltransferase [Gammaproteobacteria bacterium]